MMRCVPVEENELRELRQRPSRQELAEQYRLTQVHATTASDYSVSNRQLREELRKVRAHSDYWHGLALRRLEKLIALGNEKEALLSALLARDPMEGG
jgi:hypothetical protein